MHKTLIHSVILFCFILPACSGGGGSGSGPPAASEDAQVGGIYNGTITDAGQTLSIKGLIDEEGGAHFIELSGSTPERLIAVGQPIQTTTGAFDLGGNLVAANEATDNDQSSEAVTISGTIVPRTSLKGSYTDLGGSASFSLTYDAAAYEQPASLATVAGNYAWTCGQGCAGTFTIDSAGNISAFESAGQSVQQYTGTIDIVDPAYNVYGVHIYLTNDPSNSNYTGNATFIPGKPAQLQVVADDGVEAFYAVMNQQ